MICKSWEHRVGNSALQGQKTTISTLFSPFLFAIIIICGYKLFAKISKNEQSRTTWWCVVVFLVIFHKLQIFSLYCQLFFAENHPYFILVLFLTITIWTNLYLFKNQSDSHYLSNLDIAPNVILSLSTILTELWMAFGSFVGAGLFFFIIFSVRRWHI